MTAKEFLTQAYRIEDRITSLKRQLEAIYSPKCQTYNNIGGKASENVSITEQQGIKALELEDKLRVEIERLEGVQLDIFNAIQALDNINEQLVLRYRYIELTHDGKQPSWEIIAYKMHYSTMQTIRLHGKALEHLKF
jgi:DNA-directed RNA polymerase specialized sigma subunit